MSRIAIGDVQGCLAELQQLTQEMGFNEDRDQLWLVGDLVNRGPQSLGVLRWVKNLGGAARTVLGNHDLHLLAVALGSGRKQRKNDTLQEVLSAPDRDALLEWLLQQPLALSDPQGDILVHAGVPAGWSRDELLERALETSQALQRNPGYFFEVMYGNEPALWSDSLSGADRWRFTINALTRMRYCHADGHLDFRNKGAPGRQDPELIPWFELAQPRCIDSRIIFGHWSTLGFRRGPHWLALDSGCVWGGALTAVNLDTGQYKQVSGRGYQHPGDD
jgi:bis(5'-nucleosyl)-tetraphosphatase (symmetrical)